jgi:hypothetical protein
VSLPYRWIPAGTVCKYAFPLRPVEPERLLTPGDVLPWEHVAYRVIDVSLRPEHEDRPVMVVLRPVGLGDDPRDRDHDRHLAGPRHHTWRAYPDPRHYPVCATCGEPTPCREEMAERDADVLVARMNRHSMAGVCPACEEPVTARQKAITYPGNIEVPLGPPVTFHLRRKCFGSAVEYEKRWHAQDPDGRPRLISRPPCPGHVTKHNDGTYECTADSACPGAHAEHRSFTVCGCPECHASGPFDCHPADDAVRRDT